MHSLACALSARPSAQQWDLVSGLLYQFHSQGIDEGEEPPPSGAASLMVANEFEHALAPGVLAPPDRFVAYFENIRDAERAQRAIEPVLENLNPAFEINEVEEKNYAELWKENFKPLTVAPCWLIRAPWHDVQPMQGQFELVIEPGMAFGTGSHETTKGCLELLARVISAVGPAGRAGMHILDFGCGSGVLAIALKKLGVDHVTAVDIDPLAIQATQQNATRNHVTIECLPVERKFESRAGLDGIVANILRNTLIDHATSFRQWLKPDGFLILSGLLAEQENDIVRHYADLGFALQNRIAANEWISLALSRSP